MACGLLGVYQPGNALLAAAAARELGADEGAIRAGLRGARWPGRFQIFRRDPLVILDGAHNPAGARALAASLRAYFPGRPVSFVIGDPGRQGRGGHPRRAAAAGRALRPHRLRESSRRPAGRAAGPAAGGGRCAVDTARSPQDALAMATAADPQGIVCVAGSLSLIGDVLAAAGDGQDVLFTAGARC